MPSFGTRIARSSFTFRNDAEASGRKKERARALGSGPRAKFGVRPVGGFSAACAATSATSRGLPDSHPSFYRLFRLFLRRFYGAVPPLNPGIPVGAPRGPFSLPFREFYATLSDHLVRAGAPRKTIAGDEVAAAPECGLRSDERRVRHTTQEVTVPSVRGRRRERSGPARHHRRRQRVRPPLPLPDADGSGKQAISLKRS